MRLEKAFYNNISRRHFLKLFLSSATVLFFPFFSNSRSTSGGWEKYHGNPVLGGGDIGTCFDPFVIKVGARYRMWFSWRQHDSIAHSESYDGISWSSPTIVLPPNPESGWEFRVNRASVVQNSTGFHMWYTGQTLTKSFIGYAKSTDGINWQRMSSEPVLRSEFEWEKNAVMIPHVIFDNSNSIYRMWYSGGDQFEPDAIGYAESNDGFNWVKHQNNPIFTPNPNNQWESYKVTGCYILPKNDFYYMFYIGFLNQNYAQIGIARSKDGISGWERNPYNPIIRPGENTWDGDSVYKPTVILSVEGWWLWYNGRRSNLEQIGLAYHIGEDLGFIEPQDL